MRHVLAAIAFLVACRPVAADAPEKPPEQRFERDMMLRFHMHQNFDLVRAIERLLVRGKLEEAARFAEAIAQAPVEAPAHGPWATHVVAVRDRALAVARATTVEDALRKETRLAVACAGCHRDSAAIVFAKPPAAPPDRATIDARMARHRWAADRLWEAIVGDADDAWRAGLDVLAATPLELGPERAPLARELQRLATAARRAPPSADRAATYAELLVTCAACHSRR
ncbi:MAG: hypothetical protein KF773_17080 [Deltaproteobacteria bacterium]|nr:hypothetical protein [Deltaproteobacteria bacterium]